MPFRIRHHSRYVNGYKHYSLTQTEQTSATAEISDFDKEFEAFCAEQKRIKAERERKKKRKKKNVDNQSSEQEQTELKEKD